MSQRAFCLGIVTCVLILSLMAAAHEPEAQPADPRAFGGVMPQRSSDGELIALSYQGAIWRMPRAGGEMTRLTRGRGFDVEPVWTRDGQRIAFISGTSFGNGTLAVIDSRSGEPVKIPRELAVMDKLHFDQSVRRVLGLFQPPTEKVRLAWFDLESGELSSALPAESWPGHSPVYIEVADRPIRSPDDAAYFIKWIQRLRNDVRQRNRIPAAQQVHVEQQMSQALEFYGRLADHPSSKDTN